MDNFHADKLHTENNLLALDYIISDLTMAMPKAEHIASHASVVSTGCESGYRLSELII